MGTAADEHQGHVSRDTVEVHHAVAPPVGSTEGHGVHGHKGALVGDVGDIACQQQCVAVACRGVGPEGYGARRRTAVGVGQDGHRGLAGLGHKEQRQPTGEVALVAHYGVETYLREAPPAFGVGARSKGVEVLAVGHLEGGCKGVEGQRQVAALGSVAALGGYVQRIARAWLQAREGQRAVAIYCVAVPGGEVAGSVGQPYVLYLGAVAVVVAQGQQRCGLADVAHRGVGYARRAKAQHVDTPNGAGGEGQAAACGTHDGHHIAPPRAVAVDGVGGNKGVVRRGATPYDEASVAYGVELKVAGVGGGVAEQGHGDAAVGANGQRPAATVRVGPYVGIAGGHPSHGHRRAPFEAFTVGRHHSMGEGAETQLVAGRRSVAARGPDVHLKGRVGRQGAYHKGVLRGCDARATAEGETGVAVLHRHRGAVGQRQCVPSHYGFLLGYVIQTLSVEHATGQAQVVHRNGAAAYGQQGGVGATAHIAAQRQHQRLCARCHKGVHGHEGRGLVGELHGSHHQARSARGSELQGHRQVGNGGPFGQGQHSHAAVAYGRQHPQHTARDLGLVGRGAPPVTRHHAVDTVEVLVIGYRYAGLLHGAHRDALPLAVDTAHREGVEAVGRQTRERQRRHGRTYGVGAVGHLDVAEAVGLEMQRQLAAAHMRHHRHRGAAALQAHVVDIHLCVVGLQAAFHAEGHTPSRTAVGGKVHDHLLPARALVDMQGVDGHELSRVAPRVGTDAHQQARGSARRIEPEAQE